MNPRIDLGLPLMAVALGSALQAAGDDTGEEYLASRLGLLAAMMAVAAEEAGRWPARLRAQNAAMRGLLARHGGAGEGGGAGEDGSEGGGDGGAGMAPDDPDAGLAKLSQDNEALRERLAQLFRRAQNGGDAALLRECLACMETLVASEELASAKMLFAAS